MLDCMKRLGIDRLVLLTGDRKEVAYDLVNGFEFDRVEAGVLPKGEAQNCRRRDGARKRKIFDPEDEPGVMFVGDGVNDALALSRSSVGVAMARWAARSR